MQCYCLIMITWSGFFFEFQARIRLRDPWRGRLRELFDFQRHFKRYKARFRRHPCRGISKRKQNREGNTFE